MGVLSPITIFQDPSKSYLLFFPPFTKTAEIQTLITISFSIEENQVYLEEVSQKPQKPSSTSFLFFATYPSTHIRICAKEYIFYFNASVFFFFLALQKKRQKEEERGWEGSHRRKYEEGREQTHSVFGCR